MADSGSCLVVGEPLLRCRQRGVNDPLAVGCDAPDERLVRQIAETSREVVQQNKEAARSHHELAEGSKRLVEAVAESRYEHNELQGNLQQQRDRLELERKSIASVRQTESLLAPISTTGGLLVAALPLVLCWIFSTACVVRATRSARPWSLSLFGKHQNFWQQKRASQPLSNNRPDGS